MTQKTCSNHLVPLKLLSESESKKSKDTKKNQRMKNHWRRKINTSTTQDQMFYTVKYLNNKESFLKSRMIMTISIIIISVGHER